MATLSRIRIGTRKSALALVQAEEVKAKLLAAWPGIEVEIVPMVTSGDRFTDRPLNNIGGKGLFTKEIEEALLANTVDIAVHSAKDLETNLPKGLFIAAMPRREDPRDVLVGRGLNSIEDLPEGCVFGTSSLRRGAQVLMQRPDVRIVPLRGNVQTRLEKLDKGDARATMLAAAGLNRLNLTDIPATVLSFEQCLPAVAQGALAIECRNDDANVIDLLKPLSHKETEIAVDCERAFLAVLDGSCRTPIAGHAEVKGDTVYFRGLIVRPDGTEHFQIDGSGDIAEAGALGTEAGTELRAKAGEDFTKF